MKAITIMQPWAGLIAIEGKRFETRGWKTNYRGEIAIHASKKDPLVTMRSLPTVVQNKMFNRFYEKYQIKSGASRKMDTGSIVAIATLKECYEIHEDHTGDIVLMKGGIPKIWIGKDSDEFAFGHFANGRYAWEMDSVKLLENPVPAKGQQGLWNWKDDNHGRP